MSEDGYVEWQLPTETVTLLVLLGLARQGDGFYEFTEKGRAWIKDYCEAAIAKHREVQA